MPKSKPTMAQPSIVLFDGVCNLCNGAVQFIIKRDPVAHFRFASLQGETGQQFISQYQLDTSLGSIVLIEGGKVYLRSDAALRISGNLHGFWRYFTYFRIIPRPLRDLVYRLIANNRYRFFGKTDQCMLPSPEVRSRFI